MSGTVVAAKTNRPHDQCQRDGCSNEVGWFCWTVVPDITMTTYAVIEHNMPLFCSEACAEEGTQP